MMRSKYGLEARRVVEIVSPKYGSGYWIGGYLILTARHLFSTDSNDCKIRSRLHSPSRSPLELEARVVWRGSENIDLALVEITSTETINPFVPVMFGEIPNDGDPIPFCFYGWPKWAWTYLTKEPVPPTGGREIHGDISPNDYAPEGRIVLNPDRAPSLFDILRAFFQKQPAEQNPKRLSFDGLLKQFFSQFFSPWEGASGAAVVCEGIVVGVQSLHPNHLNPTSLEAEPISKAFKDRRWLDLLEENGISTNLYTISPRLESVAISSDGQLWACTSMEIWKLYENANPTCKELLIIGGIFGEISGVGYDYSLEIFNYLRRLIDDNEANIGVVLQNPNDTSLDGLIEDLRLNKNSLNQSLKKIEAIYKWVKETHSDSYDNQGKMEVIIANLFTRVNLATIANHGLFPSCVFNVDNKAISYSAKINSILINRFREEMPTKYPISECSIEYLARLFGEKEKEKFDELKNEVYKQFQKGVKAEESLYSQEET